MDKKGYIFIGDNHIRGIAMEAIKRRLEDIESAKITSRKGIAASVYDKKAGKKLIQKCSSRRVL